jgi:hypothetical protein
MAGDVYQVKLTIANGADKSEIVNIGTGVLVAFKTPAALTGTAVAIRSCVTRDEKDAGTTYPVLQDDGSTAVSFTYTASSIIAFTGAKGDALAACEWIQLDSNGTEAAERTFYAIVKRPSS